MKKNFPGQTVGKSDFDDEIDVKYPKSYEREKGLERIDVLKKGDAAGPNFRRGPKKKKNEKARKKWNLLKNMLLAFKLKQGESSHVSLYFNCIGKFLKTTETMFECSLLIVEDYKEHIITRRCNCIKYIKS